MQTVEKENKIKSTLNFLIPWLGFSMMQIMNIPNVIKAMETGQSMPIASVVLLISALACYWYDAIRRQCKLHMVSGCVGITSNLIVLYFYRELNLLLSVKDCLKLSQRYPRRIFVDLA